ncbi:multi-sensor signal transduction histidine kinase [Chloroherpeton thalassium ATCC 35110]|uniref:histidine kinase n=1 Tax=Chloroherpeton thalassium (strain ATCC 35110 / GB-78) TaxID=517418 RepID=B3QSA2_CHLT3|nr:PAS domain S-box protein [Chloroherpeton thalassium]ACF12493.1 multi-sensor signal transduction histidine kinase [Chloroherpeton thalassium ATCC 35110]
MTQKDIASKTEPAELNHKISTGEAAAQSQKSSRAQNSHLEHNEPEEIITIHVKNLTDLSITSISERFQTLLGYSKEALLAQEVSFRSLLEPNDVAQFNRDLQHLACGEKKPDGIFCSPFQLRHVNGASVFLHAIVRPEPSSEELAIHLFRYPMAEKVAQQKSELLKAAANANRELLTNQDFRSALLKSLQILGESTHVDRIYLFENHICQETGVLLTSQRYEWTLAGISQEIHNPDLQNMPYLGGLAYWKERLSSGYSVKGIVENMPDDDVREILLAQNIRSIMVVPIMIGTEFWGFIGFDDCTTARLWTESEEAILVSVGASVGGAIDKERSQKALLRSQAKYKSVVENIEEVIFQVDREGKCEFINEAWERITGYKPQKECLGKNLFDFFGNEKNPHFKEIGQGILEGKIPRFYETMQLKTCDGSLRWVELMLLPRCDEPGNIIGLFGTMMDSTKQVQALESLKNSERIYRRISQLISDYAYRLIPLENGEFDFKWLMVGGFYSNLGFLPNEVSEKAWFEFIYPDDRHILDLRDACLRKGEPVTIQLRVETQEGDLIWLEDAASPFLNHETGEIEEIICVISDITMRKRAEKEIRQAHDNLKVIMRTAPFGVVVVGQDQRIRWTNETVKRMARLKETDSLVGRSCSDYFCNGEKNLCPILKYGISDSKCENRFQDIHILKTVNEIVFEGEDVFLETFVDITELKNAQKALEENQQRFSIAADSAGIGVWELDLVTGGMIWDEWMFKLYQKPKEAFHGNFTDWKSALAPGEFERMDPIIQSTIASKSDNDFEMSFEIIWPSGEKRVLKTYGRALKDEAGKAVRLTGINYDITDKTKAEERIRKSQEKYKAIFNTIQDVYAEVALDGTILEISPSIKKISGYSRQEMLGKNIYHFYSNPLERENLRKELFKHGYLNDYEVKLRHLDGAVRTCSFTVSVILDRSGQPKKIVGSMRDITDRKKAEENIRKSEEKYKAIFNTIQDVYAEVALDGSILEITPSIERFTGYSREYLLGKKTSTLYKDPTARDRMVEELSQKGSLVDYEVVFAHKDGSSKMGSFIIGLQYDLNGKPYKLVGSMRDITERKKYEQDILEKEQRYRLLAHDLQKANRELKDFAYIVSHDLKAPLRAIGSLSSWLYSDYVDRLDEEGKETLSLLVGRVKRMHDLIEGILQYSRIGRIKEAFVEIELDLLIDEIVDFLSIPKHISVVKDTSLPNIIAEKTRMMQVFQNLISNAVKYNDKEHGEISIGHVENGETWQFYVKDNGPGIDEKYHEKIFQIFQTLAPRDEHESTGIGLTIVKKIIEMYGGTIAVESTMGKGTTFWIELPKLLNLGA